MYCNSLHRKIDTKTCKLAKRTMPISFCSNCKWLTNEDIVKAEKQKEKKKDIEKKQVTSRKMRKTLEERPKNKMGRPPTTKEVSLDQMASNVVEGEGVSQVSYKDKAILYRHILWLPGILNEPIKKVANDESRTSSEVIKDILRLHFGLRVSKHHPNFKGGPHDN